MIGSSHKLKVSDISLDTIHLCAMNGAITTMPLSDAPDVKPGDIISAFVYSGINGEPLATSQQPAAQLGECANMKVSSVTDAGAFLDWGIAKDLLLPYAEQRRPVEVGMRESVLVYMDNSGRLAATSKIDTRMPNTTLDFDPWQAVKLLVYQRTDMGFKAIVENRAIGLLYKDEIFQPIKTGQTLTGYIKPLRDDGRLDLSLQLPSRTTSSALTQVLLQYLHEHDGRMFITDKSSPNEIYAAFNASKKNFKRALGQLYKQRKVIIEDDCVRLNTKD